MKHESILLVGSGYMGRAYAKVLDELAVPFSVLGRGVDSARAFEKSTGISVTTGPLSSQLASLEKVPRTAILAVNAMHLSTVAKELIEHGVERLLIEKPGALDLEEMADLEAAISSKNCEAYVGYNRRFMASSLKVWELVKEDGGVSSVKFDFSEPAHRIAELNKPEREFQTWFYGNSSHVIDLAFHFFGDPVQLQSSVTGGLDWHPDGAVFAGSGRNIEGSTISWHANWIGPGRWGIEVITKNRRLILQPLEKLRMQDHSSFAETEIEIDTSEDLAFKPGIKKQVEYFLYGTGPNLLSSLSDHSQRMVYYDAIRTGKSWSK